ncbi:MAG: heptaprenylglyceryl phosphate synthase [Bacilli bacterium]
MYDISTWQHVFKLDPSKTLTEQQIEQICESGTDAIIVGGTDDVTEDGVLHLLSVTRRYATPICLECSDMDAIVPGFDYYFLPTVLNSNKAEWIVGRHVEALQQWAPMIAWEETQTVGYCICNPECKAAKLTDVVEKPTIEQIEAYALLAEKMFTLSIFYMEYSGAYGDVELVKAAKQTLRKTQLFYGGGIENKEQAQEMKQYADTIVVGNALYTNFEQALRTVTIKNN